MKIQQIIFPALVVFAIVCSLAACTPSREAEEAIKRILNDPESAKFTELNTRTNGNVCGKINAKNRMGGYVGATLFFYRKNDGYAAIVAPVEESAFRSLWLSIKLGSSFTDELSALSANCRHISEWKDVCGTPYPFSVHHLCTAISQDGASIYESLRAEFD